MFEKIAAIICILLGLVYFLTPKMLIHLSYLFFKNKMTLEQKQKFTTKALPLMRFGGLSLIIGGSLILYSIISR